MTKLYFALAACSITACAHIPGTDVPIPAEHHDGFRLAACVPYDTRDTACCYYAQEWSGAVRAVCTNDAGETWRLFEPEFYPDPGAEPAERGLGETL